MSYASVVKNGKQPVDFDDAFVQELMDKIEILTKEKSDLSTQLCQEKSSHEELNRNVNIMKISACIHFQWAKLNIVLYSYAFDIFYHLEINRLPFSLDLFLFLINLLDSTIRART